MSLERVWALSCASPVGVRARSGHALRKRKSASASVARRSFAHLFDVNFREVEGFVGGQRSRYGVQQLARFLLWGKLGHSEEELAFPVLQQLVGISPVALIQLFLPARRLMRPDATHTHTRTHLRQQSTTLASYHVRPQGGELYSASSSGVFASSLKRLSVPQCSWRRPPMVACAGSTPSRGVCICLGPCQKGGRTRREPLVSGAAAPGRRSWGGGHKTQNQRHW